MEKMNSQAQKSLLILSFLISLWTLASAWTGDPVKEWRDIKDFSEIHVNGPFEVYIIQNPIFEISLEGDQESIQSVRTLVSGHVLTISTLDYRRCSPKNVKLYIKMPELNRIRVYGNGYVKSIGLKSDHLEIELYGSGNIHFEEIFSSFLEMQNFGSGKIVLDVNAKSISASIRGSGEILLSGNANSSELSISGSGKIKAMELLQNECQTKIYGNGHIYVHASQLIDAEIIGAGKLMYQGDPEIEMTSVGSGKINRLKQEN
ncbi:MAG: DUF2807 domain-containing protein [Bacteroidetes bacterium]|nr:DUF2807 domain-containing protein [Bacteroidota bacterium]